MKPPADDLRATRRRLSRKLGRRARGKLVAVDRVSGQYVVGDSLDALLAAISGTPRRIGMGDIVIFRLGQRAAVELRRHR